MNANLAEEKGWSLDTFVDGSATLVSVILGDENLDVIVVRRGAALSAFRNRCPHFSVGLDAEPGVLHTYRNRLLMCAHHSALFRFDDGMCIEGPCKGHSLDRLSVRVVGDRVLVSEFR